MAEFRRIEDNFYVSGQVGEDDLAEAADIGIKLLINNRPDGEVGGQPTSDEVEAWATAKGMRYIFMPIKHGALKMDQVAAFGEILVEAKEPVLAFCRTGMRSCTLWALASAAIGDLTSEKIVAVSLAAGHDLGALERAMDAIRNATSDARKANGAP
jgi:uncharacterized protein (TIGR01244 family)